MRILQVIETGGPGGAETVFAQLSSGLRDRGHHVYCITKEGSWLPEEIERRGLPWSRWSSRGAFDLSLVATLRTLIRREQIDVVHAHLFDGAVYASIAARSLGVPCVVTLHGQVDVGERNWKGRAKAMLLAKFASRLVMVSHALVKDLCAALPLSNAQICVIYNGVPVESERTRTVLSTGRRLVAVGNIRAPKNYPMLISALALVREELPNVHLSILGEPDRGAIYQNLIALVQALGLQSAVTFHGFVADPSSFLLRADAFVSSSTREGFSLAVVEAMLAGVPVISTRSGGPEEIISHEVTGLLVPVDDTRALADAIERVMQDRALAERLSTAACESATRRFSLDGMVTRYLDVYADVVEHEGRTADARRSPTPVRR